MSGTADVTGLQSFTGDEIEKASSGEDEINRTRMIDGSIRLYNSLHIDCCGRPRPARTGYDSLDLGRAKYVWCRGAVSDLMNNCTIELDYTMFLVLLLVSAAVGHRWTGAG